MQRVIQEVHSVVHSQTGSMWFASIIPEGIMEVPIRILRARNVVTVMRTGHRVLVIIADYAEGICV